MIKNCISCLHYFDKVVVLATYQAWDKVFIEFWWSLYLMYMVVVVIMTTTMIMMKKKKYDWKGQTCFLNPSVLALVHCTIMKAFKGMVCLKPLYPGQ
jgi:hypothetical protein